MKMTPFFQSILNRRMLICLFTGLVSGLPLYILISMLPAWLRTEGIGLKEIGLLTLVQIPYAWKFIWSPIMDSVKLPWLGLRRGWMLISQIALLICVCGYALVDPTDLIWVAIISTAIAFFSASQDIVIDAYRREILPDEELGLGNSLHINTYRLSGLIPGSLALILADTLPWSTVFLIIALFLLIGIGLTLSIAEPKHQLPPRPTFHSAVIEPFHEFFTRHGLRYALAVLSFMVLYKLGDNLATALSTAFYLDKGYSLTEIGLIAKHAGLWPMIFGGLLGGLIMIRIGINRSLWLFGFVQIISILGFAWLAEAEKNLWLLALIISFEYLGVGLGTAASVAFIAKTTSKAHAATQFALFTALAALPRTTLNTFSGYFAEWLGWTHFFIFCTVLAIPGMLLLFYIAPWNGATHSAPKPPAQPDDESTLAAKPVNASQST
ncbi:AmpG family muropeptide MFS transporter [Zooshikella sp. RANM57]|uniref:AmpG family muropeptide MFS transporter n=1 Tax=Zooshikella sp. RANM57 TaxID=3425863 RepID=UPI003D6FE14F